MEKFVDREFKFHLTIAKVAAYYVLYLSNTPLVPFDIQRYSEHLQRGVTAISGKLKHEGSDAEGVSTGICFVMLFLPAVKFEVLQQLGRIYC